MARPRKKGLDYFPFDVDFFSDEKIICIGVEFGIEGEMAAIKLLCAIYRKGYFIEWSEPVKYKLLAQLPGVSIDLLDKIVNRLVKWGFFDEDLFDSADILTSKAIQRRYFEIAKFRKLEDDAPYLLLEKVKNQWPENGKNEFPNEKPSVSQEETPGFPRINATNKIKENEIKLNKNNSSSSEREGGGGGENEFLKSIQEYKRKTIWKESVGKKFKITGSEIDRRLDEFYLEMQCREISVQKISGLFISWLSKKLTNGNTANNTQTGRYGIASIGIPVKGKITPGYGIIRD